MRCLSTGPDLKDVAIRLPASALSGSPAPSRRWPFSLLAFGPLSLWVFCACQAPKFAVSEIPQLTGSEAFRDDGTDLSTDQPFNRVRDGVEHHTHLAVAALTNRDLDERP